MLYTLDEFYGLLVCLNLFTYSAIDSTFPTLYNKNVFEKPKNIIHTLQKLIFPAVLILICLTVASKNYQEGTYLTGWDTLHPEFNYKIYWERMLKGAWQDHQGLGDVSTQAHASEIPRVLILMAADIFLGTSQIRYFYAFLMLVLGPLGVYFLLRFLFESRHKEGAEPAAFLGALVYLFNLGTMQHFVVPLEMFLTHFGLLSWFYFAALLCLKNPKRVKNLIFFVLVNFFMVPQAHTSTLFYAHFISFGLFLFFYVLLNLQKNPASKLKRSALLVGLTLIVNAFWFLPNVYFALNHAKEVRDAKITSLFSQEAFLHNKEYGTIQDVALMKNFLFNWGVHVGNGNFRPLLEVWHVHLSKLVTQFIGYSIFGLVVIGVILAWVRKDKLFMAFSGVFLLSLFFLFNVNPPLGFLFKLFQKYVPLFGEAFRFPFTKFSILAVFTYGIFSSYTLLNFFKLMSFLFRGEWTSHLLSVLTASFITILIITYGLPFFQGHLISPYMRVRIPGRYFEMFDYLNSQEEYGRVAHLPIHTFWGWVYNSWDPFSRLGYQGAGFLWFGMKQPLLDREFDRWGMYNEQFYREMAQAVYTEDVSRMEAVLAKYKVKWLLFDRSSFSPGNPEKLMFYDEILSLFEASEKISLARDFGSSLLIYEVSDTYGKKEVIQDYYTFGDDVFGKYTDPLYFKYGDYAGSSEKNFPLVNLIGRDELVDEKFLEDSSGLSLVSPQPVNYADSDEFLFDLALKREGENLAVRLEDTSGIFTPSQVEVSTTGGVLDPSVVLGFGKSVFIPAGSVTEEWQNFGLVPVDPLGELQIDYYQVSSVSSNNFDYSSFDACRDPQYGSSYSVERYPDGFKLSSRGTVGCITAKLADLVPMGVESSFLVKVSRGVSTESAFSKTCIFDETLGLCRNEDDSLEQAIALFENTSADNIYIRFLNYPFFGAKDSSSTVRNVKTEIAYLSGSINLPLDFSAATFEKVDLPVKYEFSGRDDFSLNDYRICATGNRDITKGKVVFEEDYLVYATEGQDICDSIPLPGVSHSGAYILGIEARNVSGTPLRLCLTNEYSKRCDIYASLSESDEFVTHYFVVPPMGKGQGYTVNLSSLVFGDTDSENHLRSVSFTRLPYGVLNSAYIRDPEEFYEEKGSLLVYNESFEPGWLAFCGWKPCFANHVKVNGWANGWVFDSDVSAKDIAIVFWPNILEYLGFLGLAGIVAWLVVLKGSEAVLEPSGEDGKIEDY